MNIFYLNQQKKETLKIIAIMLLISISPILSFINALFNLFVAEGFIYDTLFVYLIFFVVLISAIVISLNRPSIDVLILAFLFIFLFIFSYVFFGKNRPLIFTNVLDIFGNPTYVFFLFSFSSYIIFRSIKNYALLERKLYFFSIIVVLASIGLFLINMSKGTQPQYMVFSYDMLAHTVFLFLSSVKKRNLSLFLLSLIGAFLIFFAGARGPIVIFVLSIALYYFTQKKQAKNINKLLIVGGTFFLFTILFNDLIIRFLTIFFDTQSFNSRTFQLILSDNFYNLSGRDFILKSIANQVTFFGAGLFGDRLLNGTYAHNILFELLSQFGPLLGLLIFISILFLVINGLFSIQKKLSVIFVSFLTTGFLKLFFSGSYLHQEPTFFLLLAFAVTLIFERNNNHENTLDYKYYTA